MKIKSTHTKNLKLNESRWSLYYRRYIFRSITDHKQSEIKFYIKFMETNILFIYVNKGFTKSEY